MDWITGIQSAVNYIEDHITDELDYEEIARQAACSNFYFQRIFSVLCGMTLGEYIRLRRLTLAGSELSATDEKVIDVALKYGYESPESFARAFSRFHGITPSEAKRDGSRLKSFSRLSVQIILKGGNIMDYRIVEKEAFRVIEKAEIHSIVDSANVNTIPGFWERARKDGTISTLSGKSRMDGYIFGICYGNPRTDAKTFEYAIGAVCAEDCVAPEGYRISEIPARTWAVFECRGAMPDAIQNLWHRICAEFFPTSGYKPTYEMDIEAYTEGDMSSPDYRSEIWVPVIK